MLNFEFDSWAALAASNPAEFERRRKQALLDQAAKAPEAQQAQLKALVNELCEPSDGSALEKAVRAQNLMMDRVVDLQRACIGLVSAAGSTRPQPEASTLAEFTRLSVTKA